MVKMFHCYIQKCKRWSVFLFVFLLDFYFTVVIICGTPDDIMDLKNGTMESDDKVVFLLIDLYKSVIHLQLLLSLI